MNFSRFHTSLLALAILARGTNAFRLFEDGKEYHYASEISATSGTMDVAAHTAGFSYKMNTVIQVAGNTLNVKFSDLKMSQYVGAKEGLSWPFDSTVYTPIGVADPKPFAIHLGDDGLVQSIETDESDVAGVNVARAFASAIQVNAAKIDEGLHGFVSEEKTLFGDCKVSYVVTEDYVSKAVSQHRDCKNKPYRLLDDFGGFKCDGTTWDDGFPWPASQADTTLVTERDGDSIKVTKIVSKGHFVAQFFTEKGSHQYTASNHTATLVEVKSSGGDISASGSKTDVTYSYVDTEHKWNVDRELKATEPFLSSGSLFDLSQADLKNGVKAALEAFKSVIDTRSIEPEDVDKAHRYGIQSVLPSMYGLDYDSLKSLAEEFLADKSDWGVMRSNLFNELLGSTGTTASALAIRDLVLEKKFDTDRDASRLINAVPFHIRRPNTQLVQEWAKLLDFDAEGDQRFTKMAIPLSYGHLVRKTCERAGNPASDEVKECFGTLGAETVQKFWSKYKASSSEEEKSQILGVLMNVRFGGVAETLLPLIKGELDSELDKSSHLRVNAMWASAWEAALTGKGVDLYLPLFADRSQPHEVRISALEVVFYTQPSASQFLVIFNSLFTEPDYEVLNYAYSLIERWANTISPCFANTAKLARYFNKYLKAVDAHRVDKSLGVSRTWKREFDHKQYGYGGSYSYFIIGSHHATAPIVVGASMGSTLMGYYETPIIDAVTRIQGVAEAIKRKIRTYDASTWKIDDLKNILFSDMSIRERPDEPLRAEVMLMYKGVVIFSRFYDDSDLGKGGKIGSFFEGVKNAGEEYTINHQRVLQLGSLLYEEPTAVGIPMGVLSGATSMGSLKATVKRGNHRGLLYRDLDYEINVFNQGVRAAWVQHPWRKISFGIVNDRVYQLHVPRKVVAGVNPIKKELKLSVSRPEHDDPLFYMMHARTQVMARAASLTGDYDGLAQNCPDCKGSRVTVTAGEDHVKSRVIVDRECEKRGYAVHLEHFRCEKDISRAGSLSKLARAFMPYNKSPRDAPTSLLMGLRQVRAYIAYHPVSEQCGFVARWSQSQVNPVKEIELSLRVNVEKNGERLFFRGRKIFLKAILKAKGEPADRSMRINLAYETTPGNRENKIKVQLNRAEVSELGLQPYTACFALENEFPDFSSDFMALDDENAEMSMSGKAMVSYGFGNSCKDRDGEIRLKFRHATTEEGREAVKQQWYWKQCQQQRESSEWSNRAGFPITEACYQALEDWTRARHYRWELQFVKLSKIGKAIISKTQAALRAGLLPFWDVDPEAIAADGDVGGFMNIDATFKNHEKAIDIQVQTENAEQKFEDVPLRLEWSDKLRNLKFTNTLKSLVEIGLISPCITTKESVRSNDNVTYAYSPQSCWTLASANCGPNPSYAVFLKQGASKPLALKGLFGGHEVVVEAKGGNEFDVSINGAAVNIEDQKEFDHTVDGTEIFKIFRWGSTVNIYSYLNVWVAFDGDFAEVFPAPSNRGRHCGTCGTFNRNKHDEFTGKNLQKIDDVQDFIKDWAQC